MELKDEFRGEHLGQSGANTNVFHVGVPGFDISIYSLTCMFSTCQIRHVWLIAWTPVCNFLAQPLRDKDLSKGLYPACLNGISDAKQCQR